MKIRILAFLLLALSLHVQAAKETWLLQNTSSKTVVLAPATKPKPKPFIDTQGIAPLLAQLYIVDIENLDSCPKVIEQRHESLIATAGSEIKVDNIVAANPKYYLIVKPRQTYTDPQTKKILGYGLQILAQAKLEQPGVPAIMHLTKTYQEVQIGNKLVIDNQQALPKQMTLYKPRNVAGLVVASLIHEKEAASHELIIINQGKGQGVLPGAVLSLLQPDFSQKVIGAAVVVKSYEHLSIAYITKASRPIRAQDKVASSQ